MLLIPSLYSSPVSPEKSEWFFHFQGAVLDNEALIKTCLPERNNGEVETQMETGGSVVHFAAAFSKLSKRRVKLQEQESMIFHFQGTLGSAECGL